jgi:hypothetical protein
MIYDFRMYTLKPGSTPDYMAAVKELALPIRQRHGIKLAGWYHSDVGELNQVVHIWAYRDHANLREAKAQVYADPDWSGKYVPRITPLIVTQKTYLMLSPDFAPEPASGSTTPGSAMVYDFRVYTVKHGTTPAYIEAVRELGLPIRLRYGVKLAGWYYPDLGELNKIVHIWAYRDHAHMKEARAQVYADPDWAGKYVPRVQGHLISQQNYLMLSPDFAPAPA